ncbi:hypothetical protein GCM10007216_00070 [Thalassobacillus devorans]|uniref:Uncharacterized protein n=1 Tax=Thalassobacillus devorans TaxID=279813 RepID=A0ABQ1NEJ3_9BACI|nr:hypothetical protein [Thalassobacillus devorans]NIK26915.1 hypothetical protein [Thalassobacillus devorans]GGC73431.1 hypothetical protein GCM10007216_00070 [Thalassobacillus devorans]
MKNLQLDLTPLQYQKLVEALFLSGWMINTTREELDEEFEALRDHVFQYYKEAGMEGLIEENEEIDCKDLNVDYESRLLSRYIENYDEQVFWEKLAEKLADCELVKTEGPVAVPLNEGQILKKLSLEEEIEEDLKMNGLQHVKWERE